MHKYSQNSYKYYFFRSDVSHLFQCSLPISSTYDWNDIILLKNIECDFAVDK